jgi:hypothetical protein
MNGRPLVVSGCSLREFFASGVKHFGGGVIAIKHDAVGVDEHNARGDSVQQLLRVEQGLQLSSFTPFFVRSLRQ